MFASGFFAEELAVRVGWTLIHSLWQIALIGGLFWIMNRKLARRSANLRYVVGCVAMLLMLAVPVCWLAFATSTIPVIRSVDLPSVSSEKLHPVPEREQVGWAVSHTTDRNDEIEAQRTTSLIQTASGSENGPLARWHGMARFIAAIWFIGVMLLSTRPALGFAYAGRLCRVGKADVPESVHGLLGRVAEAMNVRRAVQVGQSTLAKAPCVVGWFRPVILLPASAVTGLTTAELESILAHELAHIRRHDYLVNLVQLTIETLLFFHPVMWWVSQCVRREREFCCDDLAIQVCGDRAVLTDALLAVGEVQTLQRLVLASDGTLLFERVERILDSNNIEQKRNAMSRQRSFVALACALLLMVAIVSMRWAKKGEVTRQKTPSSQKETAMSERNENKQKTSESRSHDLSQLVEAVRSSDVDSVRTILEVSPALVHERVPGHDSGDTTLLHLIMPGDGRQDTPQHLEIAKLLLDHGADVNAFGNGPNLGTCRPLTVAAWGGHTKLMQLLIDRGAELNGNPECSQKGPLYAAAGHGHTAAAELLVSLGAEYELSELVMGGLKDRVEKLLIENPSLVNQKSSNGATLLHAALETGSGETLVPLLLERGADPNLTDSRGRSPLLVAIEQSIWRDQTDVIALLKEKGTEPDIFTAAGVGDLNGVRKVLTETPELAKSTQADGATPLFHAVISGNQQVVEVLLQSGAALSPRSDRFWCCLTPLHLALHTKRDEITKLLVENGADVNAHGDCTNHWQPTPLHVASRWRGPQQLNLLLDHGADMYVGGDGNMLGWINNEATLKLLFDRGLNANHPETQHLFVHSAARGRLERVKQLIEQGTNPAAKNRDGKTARELALENGRTDVVKFLDGLDSQSAERTLVSPDHPFIVAVREDDIPRVRELIAEENSLVNAHVRGSISLIGKTWKDGKEVDADEDCPEHAGALHFAAFHPGHSELAQLLIESGADLNATSLFGEKEATPLTLACWQGDDETLKVILNAAKATETRLDLTPGLFTTLAHGGDTDLLMEHGAKHDIFTAAMAGDLDVLQQLIEENTKSVDRQHPEYGRTPLEQALIVGQRASAELLVKHGAKVQSSAASALGHLQEIETLLEKNGDAVNQQFGGYTLLIWAIRGGQDDVVKLLLKHGADASGGDRWRSTPLGHVAELAYENGDAIVDLLVAAGADVNQKSRGSTPLGRAEGCGNELVIEALKRHGARGDSETEFSSTDDSNDLVQNWSDAINDRDYDRVLALLTEHPELGETRFFPREKLPGYHSATYDPSAYATMTNDLELMEAFFKGGVTPNFGTAAESPEMAKLVIKYGKDTEGFADTLSNELFSASWFANLEIQRVLLEAGADPNVRKSNSGIRPLMYVALRSKGEESLAITRQLIKHGADVNAKSYSGFDEERTRHDGYNHDVEHGHETPLHWAARKGNVSLVQLLLDHGADPDARTTSVRTNERDENGFYWFKTGGGETPRDWAFQSGDEATIRLLNGDDALDSVASAARAGMTDQVRSLVGAGKDLNATDSNDKSAIQYAIQRRDAELCRVLTDGGATWPETINTAITMGVPSVVKSLLDSDPKLKEETLRDPHAFFAKDFALDSFHVESIRAIISAKPESPMDLVLAGYIEDKDAAEAIVAARPNVVSEAITAFPQAACYFVFDAALLERLLDAGANIDARGTPHGYTPLQRAVWTSQLDSVQLLLKRGADLEIESHNHRWRTLDIPCYQSKRRVDHRLIKILLDAGADPNVEAHNGYTVLDALHHYAKKLTDEEREQAKGWVRAAGGKTYKELVQEKKGLATDEHG